MKKITQILLCLIVLGIPLAAKAGDDRTPVSEVIATPATTPNSSATVEP